MPLVRRVASSWIGQNVAASLLCFVGAELGTLLGGDGPTSSQDWPQVGIALVAFRITRFRAWAGIWVAMTYTLHWVVAGIEGLWLQQLFRSLMGGAMMLQILLGAYLLPPVSEQPNPLHSQRGVLRLFLLSGLVAGVAGLAARLGIDLLFRGGVQEVGYLALFRLSSHVAGVMVMAPLCFMLWYGPAPRFRATQVLEGLTIIVLLVATTFLASTPVAGLGAFRAILILLLLPLTLWSALRLGQWGAVTSVFAATLLPIWGTVRGMSPFGAPAGVEAEVLLQVFLIAISATTLTVAAVLEERDEAVRELKEAKAHLEIRVESRTREVRDERDFTSAVLDTIGALILVYDERGRILRFNKACQDVSGKRFEEVVGRKVWEIGVLPEEEAEEVRRRFFHPSHAESHWRTTDGSLRLFRWTNTTLEGLRGGRVFYISAGIDITEQRRAQVEAVESIRARDDFLSIASHELKTPLTTLHLQLQWLQRTASKNPEILGAVEKRLETALRQTRRLAGLVNELLDVSRLIHGRLVLEPTEVDLSSVLREVVERYGLEAAQAKVRVELAGADRPIVGYWDPLRIDQVLANLLSNAIKYGRGRPVEIQASEVDGRARVSVTDHGIGISPQDQVRIFDRFERAVSTRYYGGFGLGLWITRQVVEAHEGTIAVKSELEEGSTFALELPLRPAFREGPLNLPGPPPSMGA